ncbi:MAG: BolA family transcriptional regulator [Deltaproteobacteria bacterium]|nr:BolA family transcriptional regulator [Deltaproteobacteria bacterium]NND30685.1 BolA family transcriptional regulator [Myxococcales bacterium]MBT8466368.1 BolA family transcriptional regulator [Deltaproteobacteria bacterium]MBT8482731.1 BolA family transcriptional regulator [Deltaproteobacteria bacterium]NNK08159.1 BolA family transcriptional regulator [Myxococcales bacterium]
MLEAEVLEKRIRDALGEVSHLVITDLTGTRDHWEATVVSAAFVGKTPIEQHQMVYAALGELMAGPVHALALKTYSPESWAKAEG